MSTRRTLLKALGLAAGASCIPVAQAAAPQGDFPKGFLWGSATASYQVEGAVHEGGRGPSIWDTFSHTPGKTHNGDTGDVADDFYHRYPADIALMKDLGLKACRFSIAWSRLQPDGRGSVNQPGLDFYKRMVDELLKAGIQPYCTLYHWDLPQALQDRGGWENKDTAQAFADYAALIGEHLGDRIQNFMTINELSTWVVLGYREGIHAPGLKLSPQKVAQVAHHGVLAHGLAVQALRAHAKGARIGIADNAESTCPVIETPANIRATQTAFREENAMFLNVIMTGQYTPAYLKKTPPKFTDAELKIISSPLDFVGINVYTATYIQAADNAPGYERLKMPASHPAMDSPWLKFSPEACYWSPKLVHDLYGVKEMYITENGCSSKDEVAPDGQVYDTDRVMFLRAYLGQLQRAIHDGVPVKGYFLWSLLDNYEWADGYDKRFGITYVDFATQKRTPKLSARFYKEVIARNALV